ncbi:hypothetical protein PVL29_007064 [Vitis rotundifolia]|uniref:Uncharacterized protein n=1 Tax=Vitis rotundifolia TaxID=103349 RepID=A0AA39DUT9_VITRO|nr:hypothetical protein PVL29_007064 [Vitis rotundifolia]
MGSRVDLSFSKRTRKPMQPQPRRYNLNLSLETGRPSLMQLMDGDAEAAKMVVQSNGRMKKKCSNSLGSHFAEEEEKKQPSSVVKQGKHGVKGLRLRGMVSRCVKILSHLIKD